MILRNFTQKYNCVADFVVCCAPGFCSAVALRHQSNRFQTDLLCNQRLVCVVIS